MESSDQKLSLHLWPLSNPFYIAKPERFFFIVTWIMSLPAQPYLCLTLSTVSPSSWCKDKTPPWLELCLPTWTSFCPPLTPELSHSRLFTNTKDLQPRGLSLPSPWTQQVKRGSIYFGARHTSVWVLTQLFTSCGTLNKSIKFYELQFSYVWNENDSNSYEVFSVYYMPNTTVRAVYVLVHLNHTKIVWSKCYYYPI